MTGGYVNQAPFLREPRGFHGHGCAPIAGGFVLRSHHSKWMMTWGSPMTKRKPPSLTGASFPNEMENCTRKIPWFIIILDCGLHKGNSPVLDKPVNHRLSKTPSLIAPLDVQTFYWTQIPSNPYFFSKTESSLCVSRNQFLIKSLFEIQWKLHQCQYPCQIPINSHEICKISLSNPPRINSVHQAARRRCSATMPEVTKKLICQSANLSSLPSGMIKVLPA